MQMDVLGKLMGNAFKWLGHMLCMETEELVKRIYGRKKQGRRKKR